MALHRASAAQQNVVHASWIGEGLLPDPPPDTRGGDGACGVIHQRRNVD
jgi:hypothetical protein